jgi:archaemetzincin
MKSKGSNHTLSRRIAICCLGPLDPTIPRYLADHISTRCDLTCDVSPSMESPTYAFDKKRCQHNSKLILKRLAGVAHDALKLLAITDVDLFVPILTYVFGLAEVGGPCAVISTNRLRPQFYGYPPNQVLLMERIEKTALHELGHSLGLIHCRDRRCVMHSSTSIADTDFKQSHFCPTCFEIFRWHIEDSGIRAGPHMPKI